MISNKALTLGQVADRLHVSRQRVWVWVIEKRIKASRVGSYWYVEPKNCVRPPQRMRGKNLPK